MRWYWWTVLCSGLACSETQPLTPRGASSRALESWDGTRIVRLADGQRVLLSGPVRRAIDPADKETERNWITERCFRIAHGVPFFQERLAMYTPSVRLQELWNSAAALRHMPCEKMLGAPWRLPERNELLDLAELEAVPEGLWFYRSAQGIGALSFRAGKVLLGIPPQFVPSEVCLVPRATRAGVVCISPDGDASAPSLPSDDEIRACVSRVESFLDQEAPALVLPQAHIELFLSVRRACREDSDSMWNEAIANLEKAQRKCFADAQQEELNPYLSSQIEQLDRSLSFVGSVTGGCQELVEAFERECSVKNGPASRCLALQISYSAGCLGDAAAVSRVQKLLHSLRSRLEQFRSMHRGKALLLDSVFYAERCTANSARPFRLKYERRLRELLKEGRKESGSSSRTNEPTELADVWVCDCAIDELECGLSAIMHPERCLPPPASEHSDSDQSEPSTPEWACDCVPSDLQCNMRCPK